MFRRLPYCFLIVAASSFVALKCYLLVRGRHLETGLTKNDYLDFAKAILALLSIVLGVFLLRRDRR
jgi:hypothetical protein